MCGHPRTLLPNADSLVERAGLSWRELDMLSLVARGDTNAEIARELGISERTVQKHLQHINAKLGVGTRTAAVARAAELAG